MLQLPRFLHIVCVLRALVPTHSNFYLLFYHCHPPTAEKWPTIFSTVLQRQVCAHRLHCFIFPFMMFSAVFFPKTFLKNVPHCRISTTLANDLWEVPLHMKATQEINDILTLSASALPLKHLCFAVELHIKGYDCVPGEFMMWGIIPATVFGWSDFDTRWLKPLQDGTTWSSVFCTLHEWNIFPNQYLLLFVFSLDARLTALSGSM